MGKYQLLEKLGGGTFGEVWLAEHAELPVERAMKIPTDPQFIRQLRAEGRIGVSLSHPNIVQTFDLDTASDPPFVVMEYVAGTDLRKRLRASGKLPADHAVAIRFTYSTTLKGVFLLVFAAFHAARTNQWRRTVLVLAACGAAFLASLAALRLLAGFDIVASLQASMVREGRQMLKAHYTLPAAIRAPATVLAVLLLAIQSVAMRILITIETIE